MGALNNTVMGMYSYEHALDGNGLVDLFVTN